MEPDIIERLTMLQATYPDMPEMFATLEQAKRTIQRLRENMQKLSTSVESLAEVLSVTDPQNEM